MWSKFLAWLGFKPKQPAPIPPPVVNQQPVPKPVDPPVVPPVPVQIPSPAKDTHNDGNPKSPDWHFLWDNCLLDGSRIGEVAKVCAKIIANKSRYVAVQLATSVPWYLVAALHYRESGMNFTTYLHNGDPLGKTTTHVPKGVFFGVGQWTEAAIDALKRDGLDKVGYKDVVSCLVMAEKFNGMGYRSHGEYSPYDWAGTNMSDETGKYTGDGHFDSSAHESQLSVAAIFKGLQLVGEKLSA